jgi:hypothetical protein
VAKGFGYVETGKKESDGGGEDGEVIGERKPFGAYNRPEFAEEELETKDEEEGGKGASLLNPPFNPDFMVGGSRKDRDNPNIREEGVKHE